MRNRHQNLSNRTKTLSKSVKEHLLEGTVLDRMLPTQNHENAGNRRISLQKQT